MCNNPITSITIYRCTTESKIRIRRKHGLSKVYKINTSKRAEQVDSVCLIPQYNDKFYPIVITVGVGGIWLTIRKKETLSIKYCL